MELTQIKDLPRLLAGKRRTAYPPFALKMRELMAGNGWVLISDPTTFAERMAAAGIPESERRCILFVLQSDVWLSMEERLRTNYCSLDLSHVVTGVTRDGLQAEAALRAVQTLAYGLGLPLTVFDHENLPPESESGGKSELFIPPAVYEEELDEIERLLRDGDAPDEAQTEFTAQLYRAKVPRAARLMGMMYGAGLGVEKNEKSAMKCLYQAAKQGDCEAAGLLGDAYMAAKDYEKARKYYLFPGAMALNAKRAENLDEIDRMRTRIAKEFLLLCVMFALSAILMLVFLRESAITGPHTLSTIICTVIGGVLTAGLGLVHWVMPYQSLIRSGIVYLVLFFVHSLIFIL